MQKIFEQGGPMPQLLMRGDTGGVLLSKSAVGASEIAIENLLKRNKEIRCGLLYS